VSQGFIPKIKTVGKYPNCSTVAVKRQVSKPYGEQNGIFTFRLKPIASSSLSINLTKGSINQRRGHTAIKRCIPRDTRVFCKKKMKTRTRATRRKGKERVEKRKNKKEKKRDGLNLLYQPPELVV